MALGKFHSLRGEKSALILVKANEFQMTWTPVYVPKDAVEGYIEGDTFPVPDGYKLIPIVDIESGEVRTAKDGSVLNTLVW